MSVKLHLECKPFDALTSIALHDIFALRSEVFVVEQNCIYQDIDGKDPQALHLIGKLHNQIVLYARLFGPDIAYPGYASIGRILTAFSCRGKSYGHQLMAYAIQQCTFNFPDCSIKISAQAHLEKFYNQHRFFATGESYLEDGIPHIGMIHDGKHFV